jgi:hypothetical protein
LVRAEIAAAFASATADRMCSKSREASGTSQARNSTPGVEHRGDEPDGPAESVQLGDEQRCADAAGAPPDASVSFGTDFIYAAL